MKIALQGSTLLIKEADNVQFAVIKSWNKMRWDRKTQLLTGTADMELLDKLASIVQLPPAIAQRRSQLHRVQEAIDSERVNPHPKPLADYPVKMSLYDHQVRGANMCLVAFGWANPDAIERRNGSHALNNFSIGDKVELTPDMKLLAIHPEKYEIGEVVSVGSWGIVDILWNGFRTPIGMRSDELKTWRDEP